MVSYYGGTGNDSINGSFLADSIAAYGGNDTVTAGDGADTISGGDGNDSLSGGNGYDFIYGDAGDDRLYGGNDTFSDLYGGTGNDSLYAGDANDDWAWGGDGQDLVYMGGGADIGYGGSGQDTVYGGAGNDSITGASGNDQVLGEAGRDAVYGGAGRDTLDGGAENDTLGGGSGADSVQGGLGNDLIYGDRDAYIGSMDASTGPINTTLTIVNAAPFAVDVYWIDTTGVQQYFATVQPGGSYSASTGTGHTWFLSKTGSVTPIEVIYGAANQTITFGPDFNDTLMGGDGDDTLYSDYGSDLIYGDTGNDSVIAGDGNDTVFGGDGADTLSLGAGDDSLGTWGGETGDDSIDGGAGNDSIIAGAGNDVVYGGDGNDTSSGASGSDTLYGGAGADAFAITDDHEADVIHGGETGVDFDAIYFANYVSTQGVVVSFTGAESGTYRYVATNGAGSFSGIEQIAGTAYADTLDASLSGSATDLSAGAGDDLVKGGTGADTICFGSGNDTVFGGAGDDVIDDVADNQLGGSTYVDGGAGNDTVWTGDGADTVLGGDGADALMAEAGNDLVKGGAGYDSLYGGDGNDVLQGGTAADLLYGGAGQDLFQFVMAGGGDVIGDFDLTLATGRTVDQLDVSDLRNPDGSALRGWDVQVTDDGQGNAVLTFPQGESVVLQGIGPAAVMADGMLAAMGVPCFAHGTLIDTARGARRVETIRPGDSICTAQGPAKVLWHGARSICATDLAEAPEHRPVKIAAGVIGNLRPLTLSPQHAVRVPGIAGLIRARHLVETVPGVRIARGMQGVRYHHLLLPQHALVRAEGAWVESFYPGRMAVAGLAAADRLSLIGVILAGRSGGIGSLAECYGPRILPLLSRRMAISALLRRSKRPDRGSPPGITLPAKRVLA